MKNGSHITRYIRKSAAVALAFLMLVNIMLLGIENIDWLTANAATSGTCGTNLTWELSDDGVLTISGTGEMDGWFSDWFWPPPWREQASSIEEVVLNGNITSIGDNAFAECVSLKSITIPSSVTSIGIRSFENCSSLKQITIPDSVTSIGVLAFQNCSLLENVLLSKNITEIPGSIFSECTSLKNIVIPDSVSIIDQCAFHNCTSLETVSLPSSLEAIYIEAFYGCSSLKNIAIPESVTTLGVRAFANCSSLESVVFQEGITYIQEQAFDKCQNLKRISLPSTLERIEYAAFFECCSISDVYYPGNEEDWNDIFIAFGNDCLLSATRHYSSDVADILFLQQTYGDDFEQHYFISVRDSAGHRVSGASVKLGNAVAVSDEKGYAIFDKISIQNAKLVITADNYPSYSINNYSLKQNGQDVIVIGSPIINSVVMNYNGEESELLTTKKTIDLKYQDTEFSITVNSSNSNQIAGYWLVGYPINSKNEEIPNVIKFIVFPEGDQSESTGVFNLTINDFRPTETETALEDYKATEYYIRYKLTDGSVHRIKIHLDVIDTLLEDEIVFEIGGGDGVKFGDGWGGILSGCEIKVPALKSPLSLRVTPDGKICIGANIFEYEAEMDIATGKVDDDMDIFDADVDFDEEWEKITKNWDDYFKNYTKPTKKGSLTGGVKYALYLEGRYKDNSLDNVDLSGRLSVQYAVEFGATGQWTVFVAEIGVSGKIGADCTFAITSLVPLNMEAELLLNGSIGLEISGGVGAADIADLQIYGGGSLDVEYLMWSSKHDRGFTDVKLEFGWGLKCTILFSEFKQEFGHKTIPLYSRDISLTSQSSSDTAMLMMSNAAAARYNTASYSMADRSYRALTSAWLGSTAGTGSTEVNSIEILQESAYTGIVPQLISCGETTMLVYADDIASRTANNRTAVVYSLYNSSDGTWSAPAAIDDDGTADFNPIVHSDGNSIWVAWLDSPDVISDDADVSEVSKTLELCTAKYDTNTESWSIIGNATDNSDYELHYDFASVNGKTCLVYITNDDSEIFGQTSNNTLHCTNFSESGWSESSVIASNLNSIVSFAAGSLDGGLCFCAIQDSDCDLITTEDCDLYVYDSVGNAVQITSDSIAETNPQFINLNGSEAISWQSGGNIYTLSSISGTPNALLNEDYAIADSSAKIVSDGNNAVIIFTKTIDETSQLYCAAYDSGTNAWNAPIKLTAQNDYIRNAVGTYCNDQLILVFNQIHAVITNESLEENYNLCWLKSMDFTDLAVSSIIADQSAVAPNAAVTVNIEVENKGTSAIEHFNITFKAADGIVISETIADKTIPSGTSDVLITRFTAPATITTEPIIVTVTPYEALDNNSADNTIDLTIGYADLSVESNKVTVNGSDVLMISVNNSGSIASGGKLTLTTTDGTVLLSEDVPVLHNGEEIQYTAEIDDAFFSDNTNSVIVTCSVIADEEEFFDYNNISKVTLDKHRAYVTHITANQDEVTASAGSTVDADYTVYPLDAENKAVSMSSSNTSVAVIENGKIKAVGEGKAIITITTTDGELTDSFELTVFSIDTIDEITLDAVAGTNPDPPSEIIATLSDGSKIPVKVTWDAIPEETYNRTGSFVIEGTVEGFTEKVKCTITVRKLLNIVAQFAGSKTNGRPASVTLTPVNGTQLKFVLERNAEKGGNMSVSVGKGTYLLNISKPGHTSYTNKTFDPDTDSLPSVIYLYPGDITGDGRILAHDQAAMTEVYGLSSDDSAYTANADFNEDGYINAKDRADIIANFGKTDTVVE